MVVLLTFGLFSRPKFNQISTSKSSQKLVNSGCPYVDRISNDDLWTKLTEISRDNLIFILDKDSTIDFEVYAQWTRLIQDNFRPDFDVV